MGNQHGTHAGGGGGGADNPNADFAKKFKKFNKEPIITLSGLTRRRAGTGAPPAGEADTGKSGGKGHHQNDGGIFIGATFVTWLSSALTEVSYMKGTVVDVFEMSAGTPLYGDTRKHEQKKKYVVLKYDNGRTAELDIPGLKASVARAQQAMIEEQEWRDKIRALGLVEGESSQLWVSENHQSPQHVAARRQSHHLRGLNSGVGAQPDLHCPKDEPGNLRTFKLLNVSIGWHFQDPVVMLELSTVASPSIDAELEAEPAGGGAAAGSDREGEKYNVEVLPLEVVKAMLEDAQEAKALLAAELHKIDEYEGIRPETTVDLWIEELDTNVRGVIVKIGHTFQSLSKVELQPAVKYFVDGKRHIKRFADYVSFVTSWKQAKYVAEQQFLLTQEAFEKGVSRGSEVSIFQEAQTERWPLKEGGALDAIVEDLIFDFNPSKYLVSMRVRVRYHHITGTDAHVKRRISIHEGALAVETLPWEQLVPRLRCKITVSNISCRDLIDRGKADPYVKLVIGPSKRKTPFLENEPDPSWEGLEFVFRQGEDRNRNKVVATYKRAARVLTAEPQHHAESLFEEHLHIYVYDQNRLSRRSFMGEAMIELSELIPSGKKEYTIMLGPEHGTKKTEA